MNVIIRSEQPDDESGIRSVNTSAFDTPAEADLVDRLRVAGRIAISLVAELDGQIVGHILFTRIYVNGTLQDEAFGLAPMAVLPVYQRHGIGSHMIKTGIDTCRSLGGVFIVVLGHVRFYQRFGFIKASTHGLRNVYGVDDPFMVLPLAENTLPPQDTLITYDPLFEAVE